MNRFLLQLFALSIFAGIGIWIWNTYSPEQKQLNDLWFILAFFVLITFLAHYLLVGRGDTKPNQFVRNFMGITSLKLLLCLFSIVVYGILNRAHAIAFIVGFLIHYLVFTAFEVVILLKHFSQNKPS
ncbi:MAG: hypothetical protein JNL63_10620 [Bacteroidia bacterium]|nr:hypothetical protein [Bacteroidia bacterium]